MKKSSIAVILGTSFFLTSCFTPPLEKRLVTAKCEEKVNIQINNAKATVADRGKVVIQDAQATIVNKQIEFSGKARGVNFVMKFPDINGTGNLVLNSTEEDTGKHEQKMVSCQINNGT